jgi:hypothetical protein
MDQASSTKMT